MKIAIVLSDPTAIRNSTPTFRSASTIRSPKGITAKTTMVGTNTTIGASQNSMRSASSPISQPPRPSRHSERRPHLGAEPSHLREGIWRGAGIRARSLSFRTSLSPFPSARYPSSSVNLTHDNVHTPQDHDRVRHCPSNTHQLQRRQVDVRRRPDMKAKRSRTTVANEVGTQLATGGIDPAIR